MITMPRMQASILPAKTKPAIKQQPTQFHRANAPARQATPQFSGIWGKGFIGLAIGILGMAAAGFGAAQSFHGAITNSKLPNAQIEAVERDLNQANLELSSLNLTELNRSGLAGYFAYLSETFETFQPGSPQVLSSLVANMTDEELTMTQNMLESLRSENNWQENWQLQSNLFNEWVDNLANGGRFSLDEGVSLKQTAREMFQEIAKDESGDVAFASGIPTWLMGTLIGQLGATLLKAEERYAKSNPQKPSKKPDDESKKLD